MKYALIIKGVVEQIQPNKEIGFIEVDDEVVCGMIDSGLGIFTIPTITIQMAKEAKIQDIENAFNIASNLPITIGTKSYNGGKESASSIMAGVDLANLNLETSIQIWDINNDIAVYSITDAMHIVKIIALDYRAKILAKQAKVMQVNAIVVDPQGTYPTHESAIAALNLI